ncbi:MULTISPECIES: hypothetical protein [Pseudomonas]|uniref:Phage tail protein n=1 Tax=Pseudomonas cedrina TaxID=651740 RepID=A0A2S9DN56_PSECE|nr:MULTISPECIES: hypothetical protein [Pseudomonas]AVJ23973.1 hypothetical protein CLM72_20475 [Pseudomonas sp. MYb193]PRC02189.1 hypothetical protein CQ006_15975 [Pseudomonas cedrina]
MTVFYSAEKKGFYDSELHALHDIPTDAQPITHERHQELLMGQSDRKVILADDEGVPYLSDPPPVIPDVAELVRRIDDYAANQYTYLNRFEVEYRERSAAANTYKDAGYNGEPGIWITSFARATALEPQAAAERILSQSAALADAFAQLAALRMRKYEVSELQGLAALERAKEITTAMDQVVATID